MTIDERHLAEKLAGTQSIVDGLVGTQGNADLDLTLVDDVGAIAEYPLWKISVPAGKDLRR